MKSLKVLILAAFLLSACHYPRSQILYHSTETAPTTAPKHRPDFTLPPSPLPASPVPESYHNGDTIPYYAQPGDTLPNLASRFQTTLTALFVLNPGLQNQPPITFLPVGTPIMIKLGQEPDWGSGQTLLPNDLFVNGPTEADFNLETFVNQNNGWLKTYIDNSSGNHVTGVQIVNDIAQNYSISPRLIVALLEYQLHGLSDHIPPASYSLGNPDEARKPLTNQISWMANTLNNGFYGWQDGKGSTLSNAQIRLNPWLNSATTALLYYFSLVKPSSSSQPANKSAGEFILTYQKYFGTIDWNSTQVSNLLPPGLSQPKLILPFGPSDKKWLYSGGPHSGWGVGDPLAALDFAPPSETAGCDSSPEWALAVADGVIARSDDGLVILDLDGDGKYQTGWAIQYLHLLPASVPGVGSQLKQGDPIGHPSCIGGHASGRHVHVARLYNGVWISTSDPLPFNLAGWVATAGGQEYQGLLTRGDVQVPSSIYGEGKSQISADAQ
jgi:LasA protease